MNRIIFDYIILELDRIFDVKEVSGLLSLNESYVDGEQRDRNIYKRIYGTVISIPRGYTDTKIEPIDPGVPNPKIYVGHDLIQSRVNEGYDWKAETHYYPTAVESYEFKTVADVGQYIDVRVGDKVYVHPNSLDEENALWKKDDKYYFRVRVDEILCAVRDGELVAQGQRVLLKPHMENQSEIMQRGLQIKPNVEAKPLQGFVLCARPEFCAVGVLVFFVSDADWLITIEGTEVYCLKEEEIMVWLETTKAFDLKASDVSKN
jgi:hypothetical protein